MHLLCGFVTSGDNQHSLYCYSFRCCSEFLLESVLSFEDPKSPGVKSLQSQNIDTLRMTTQEIKLIKTILVTVLAYAIFRAPVIITDLVDQVRGGWAHPRGFYVIYTVCGIASSCINPVVYGIMNKSFRGEYIRLLGLNKTKNFDSSLASVKR